MNPIVINGTVLCDNITGIPRYVYENVVRLDKLIEGTGLDVRIAYRDDGRPIHLPELKNIRLVPLKSIPYFYNLAVLPAYLRRTHAFYVGLASDMLLTRRSVVVLHDIRPLVMDTDKGLDGEEVPERLGKHNKLHHCEHEKRDKQQLHVLPGRLVDRRKRRDHTVPTRPFVDKVQQRPSKACCGKTDDLPSVQFPFHAPSSLSAPVKPGKHYSLRGKEGLYTAKAALNRRLLHFFSYSANRGTMTPAGAAFVSSKLFPSSLRMSFASHSARNSSSVPISGYPRAPKR